MLLENQIEPLNGHTVAYMCRPVCEDCWLWGARWAAISFGRTDGGELGGRLRWNRDLFSDEVEGDRYFEGRQRQKLKL